MKTPLISLIIFLMIASCRQLDSDPGVKRQFELLTADKTGIDFRNDLKPTKEFNIFNYMYFYNGSGVGAGDFNNDGLTDLFFGSNQGENGLYINQGNLRFRNASQLAGINAIKGWSNGISITDINQDGLLDIYVSRLSLTPSDHNLLWICQEILPDGTPVYTEKSAAYNLNLSVYATQATFFDVDLDGDLDLYMMCHPLEQKGTFGNRQLLENVSDEMAGDKLLRNDHGKFIEISRLAGISSTVLGYGLGLAISDVDLDGYPDIYVGNDFYEKDYLYFNQRNGKFSDLSLTSLKHTSQFSMGVDMADLNNDALPEILSLDMLPSDYEILKRSEGEEMNSMFRYRVRQGYGYQFPRNCLQFNNGNRTFSEIGMYAGIHATDWSWSPLMFDFDNDGLRDIFITNGIPKRMNDIDYIKFASSGPFQDKLRAREIDDNDASVVDKIPEIKIPNTFFQNKGDLTFKEIGSAIKADKPSYSNGAVYADLDNDGDLDVATNNINDDAFIYQNLENEPGKKARSLRIYLHGSEMNKNAVGAKCLAFQQGRIIAQQKFPVRGFMSSTETPVLLGLGENAWDSLLIIWPDNRFQKLLPNNSDSLSLRYAADLPEFDYAYFNRLENSKGADFQDITRSLGIRATHTEDDFQELDLSPLNPIEQTVPGPAVAVGDVNGDGLDDFYVSPSKNTRAAIYLQAISGKFSESKQPGLEKDSLREESSAILVDIDGDSKTDLVTVAGGNDPKRLAEMVPNVFLNDGNGRLIPKEKALTGINVNASTVVPIDFDQNGTVDLFIGGRSVPGAIGETPHSWLMANDGSGKFTDVTEKWAPGLSQIGKVKAATVTDINADSRPDLLVALEWGGIESFINAGKKLSRKTLTDKKGWWNCLTPADFDGDGDLDIFAGNWGLNNRFIVSETEPLRMYVGDFNNNGSQLPVLTYYLQNEERIFAPKAELDRQMPGIRKKYLKASDFAKASLGDVFDDQLEKGTLFEANYLASAILENNGTGQFSLKQLPFEAQWTPIMDAQMLSTTSRNLPEILCVGNFFNTNVQLGRYDANMGFMLNNTGKNNFTVQPLNEAWFYGQARKIKKVNIGEKPAFIIARNNDSYLIISAQFPTNF